MAINPEKNVDGCWDTFGRNYCTRINLQMFLFLSTSTGDNLCEVCYTKTCINNGKKT